MTGVTRGLAVLWCCVGCTALCAGDVLAAATYNITDLGRFDPSGDAQATAINSAGVVTGGDFSNNAGPGGFRWDGSLHALPALPPDTGTGGFAINSQGVVAGESITSSVGRAVIWQGDTVTLLNVGGTASHSYGINDATHVAGTFRSSNHDHAFFWKNGSTTDLGTLGGLNAIAYSVNNSDVVVGSADTSNGNSRAFQWIDANNNGVSDAGEMTQLPDNGLSSAAYTVNNSGVAGGFVLTASFHRTAALWSNGTRTDLPALPGATDAEVWGVNASGQAIGESQGSGFNHAVLWSGGQVQDLLPMVTAGNGWNELLQAFGINDQGEIVGYGRIGNDGDNHAFLLTPIPEPTGFLASVLMAGLCLRRRRSCA